MGRGDGTYAPRDGLEMSSREARALAREIVYRCPTLKAEAWAIAQGLAYIKVSGPSTRGLVDLVLHDKREYSDFWELLR